MAQSLEITRQRIISSTVNLSKRQRTWFKKDMHKFSGFLPPLIMQVVDYVTTELNTLG